MKLKNIINKRSFQKLKINIRKNYRSFISPKLGNFREGICRKYKKNLLNLQLHIRIMLRNLLIILLMKKVVKFGVA